MSHNDQPPGGHDDDPKDDKPFDGETRLFIRDNILDDGSVPSPQPTWLSPDIAVTPPGGALGGDPIVGQPNIISVTVRNSGGIHAMGVWVDAFACDPTTGWTPASAEAIGGTYVDVPPTSQAVANITWTPPPGPSHRCLMARASLLIPADTYANPLIFDVMGERRVAQHNVHLVTLAQNQMTITFGFLAVNGGAKAGEFLLMATHVEPTPRAMRMLTGGLGCGLAQWGQTPLRGFELTLGGRIVPGQQNRSERRTGVLVQPLREMPGRPTLARPQSTSQRLKLEASEVRQAFLTVARNSETRPGDLHVIEMAQIDARSEQVTGGLWLVLRH